jgi:hypothetical protein
MALPGQASAPTWNHRHPGHSTPPQILIGRALRNGDNPEAKKIAEKSIQEQEKSIKELTAWLDKNARKEGKQ